MMFLPRAPDLAFEIPLWEAGLNSVAGLDEVGRGALAGPVAAAAVILPPHPEINEELHGVRDSKQMSPQQRTLWADRLRITVLAYGIGWASSEEIDEFGIVPATRAAFMRALESLPIPPQHLLLDYLTLPECLIPQTSLVKGDCRSLSIASASILAKTSRDELMCKLDVSYPGYRLTANKGYGTAAHRRALAYLGPSPIHRRSFRLSGH